MIDVREGKCVVRGDNIIKIKPEGDVDIFVESGRIDARVLIEKPGLYSVRLVNSGNGIVSSLRIWTICDDVDVKGDIVVERGMKNVDTSLDMKAIGKRIIQRPWLEAFSNEIKARHSASMITFTQQQIFYSASRGIHPGMMKNVIIDEIRERFESEINIHVD